MIMIISRFPEIFKSKSLRQNTPQTEQSQPDTSNGRSVSGLKIMSEVLTSYGKALFFPKKEKETIPEIAVEENMKVQTPPETPVIDEKPKVVLSEVKHLGNERIEAVLKKGDNVYPPVELPEYLYHVTSGNLLEKIIASGKLRTSENEQLKGIYLLDKKNFLERYGNVEIQGKNHDLISAIFRHANACNKEVSPEQAKIGILKIPTEELLSKGKLRIRTQEDFFACRDILKEIYKKTGEKYTVRSLADDETREKFGKIISDDSFLGEKAGQSFLEDMTNKLHYGYSLHSAADKDLENNSAIEYIYNKNLNLSEIKGLSIKEINVSDYLKDGTTKFSLEKIPNAFSSEGFVEYNK